MPEVVIIDLTTTSDITEVVTPKMEVSSPVKGLRTRQGKRKEVPAFLSPYNWDRKRKIRRITKYALTKDEESLLNEFWTIYNLRWDLSYNTWRFFAFVPESIVLLILIFSVYRPRDLPFSMSKAEQLASLLKVHCLKSNVISKNYLGRVCSHKMHSSWIHRNPCHKW